MTTKAAIYCRISDDREGRGLGVTRQQEDCEALAKKNGWEIVQIFVDNDISAYSGKKRPSYLEMMRDIRSGRFQAIIAWHPDRLHRSPLELEEFITACESSSINIQTVQAGFVDLNTPAGRMNARVLGSFARYESEHKSERIKRKALQSAQEGKVWGRSQRPFGFELDYITIRNNEARAIREIADRFLSGESMNSLAKWLNGQGFKTGAEGEFSHQNVRRILYGARWSGRREHHGEIISKGIWDAIIEPEKQDAIRTILNSPERKNEKKARRYLLSGGLIKCGDCGTTMISHPKEGVRRYVCRKNVIRGKGGCGSMYIKADWVENLICDGIVLRLSNPAMFLRLTEKKISNLSYEQAYSEFIKAKAKEIELAELFTDGTLNRTQLIAGKKKLEPKIKKLEEALSKVTQLHVSGVRIAEVKDLLSNWSGLNLERQRAIVKLIIDNIVITKGRAGYNKFDPSRIHVNWKI